MAATTQLSISRFEKLFSRRRVLPTQPQRLAEQPRVLPDVNDEPLFPSPSFIKPTANRMVAREEIAIVKSPSRANLHNTNLQKPESTHVVSPTCKSVNSRYSNCSGSSGCTVASYIKNSPSTVCSSEYTTDYPASSISFRHLKAVIPRLTFQLSPNPEPIQSDAPLTPFSPDFAPRPSFCSELSINSYFEGGKLESFPHPPCFDTPPPSEADKTEIPKLASPAHRLIAPKRIVKRGPAPDFSSFSFPVKTDAFPTSIQLPSMPPRRSLPPTPVVAQIPKRIVVSNPEPMYDLNVPRRSSSISYTDKFMKVPQSPVRPKTSASADVTLSEPTVLDFMDLADDDIAEEEVQTVSNAKNHSPKLLTSPASLASGCARAHTNSKPSERFTNIPDSHSIDTCVMTLPPPIPSQPSALAAINAQRIATRYDFNLVYVVNLWPTSVDPMVTPTRNYVPDISNRLTGRLLAAYGLEKVQSPFRISSVVHSRILQADGWIEYRLPDNCPISEFTQGYACSFYTGQYGRRKSEGNVKPSGTGRDSVRKNIDRGIVFAAYRKPSKDRVRRNYSKQTLQNLHDDAEALVELLLDTHFMSSLRNPAMFSQNFEETGPMPARTPHIYA